ncbi:unnamed protein product [Lota lota]
MDPGLNLGGHPILAHEGCALQPILVLRAMSPVSQSSSDAVRYNPGVMMMMTLEVRKRRPGRDKACLRQSHWAEVAADVSGRPSNDQDAFRTPERRAHVCSATVSSRDPIGMLRGMDGYQLTQTDQDFMDRMNEERLRKHLEGELAGLEKAINKDAMALDLELALKGKAFDELKKASISYKFPSCEEMADLARAFLNPKRPVSELDGMDHKTLLAQVEERAVLVAVSKQKEALVVLEERVYVLPGNQMNLANLASSCCIRPAGKGSGLPPPRAKRSRPPHEIKELMIQLANLRLELAQETEKCTALEVMAAALPAVQIKMAADAKQKAVRSQSSRKRSVTTAETSAVFEMPINVASRTLRSQPPNGRQDDQSVTSSGRGKAKNVRIASTAASKPIKPATDRATVEILAARHTVVTTTQNTSRTGNALARQPSQKGGKFRDSKPKGGKPRDSEPVASLPAVTAVKETAEVGLGQKKSPPPTPTPTRITYWIPFVGIRKTKTENMARSVDRVSGNGRTGLPVCRRPAQSHI